MADPTVNGWRPTPPPPGPGRPKGSLTRNNKLLQDAVLKAAEIAGDGKGKKGLVEYLVRQANANNPGPFMALLGRVIIGNAIKDASKIGEGINIHISGGLPSIGAKSTERSVTTNPRLLAAAAIEADDELEENEEAPVIEGTIDGTIAD
jgi:hypothetical protein